MSHREWEFPPGYCVTLCCQGYLVAKGSMLLRTALKGLLYVQKNALQH